MSFTFISYSSIDRSEAKELAEKLEATGLRVWWDYALVGGTEFRSEIHKKLEEAAAVIVLWSKNSVTSHWVLDEADEARRRKILIPVTIGQLETIRIPLGFRQLHTISVDDPAAIRSAVMRVYPGTEVAAFSEQDVLSSEKKVQSIIIGGISSNFDPPIDDWSARYRITKGFAGKPRETRKVVYDAVIDLLSSTEREQSLAALRFIRGHLHFFDMKHDASDAMRVCKELAAYIRSQDRELAIQAMQTINSSPPDECSQFLFPIIVDATSDATSEVRTVALRALGELVSGSDELKAMANGILVSAWQGAQSASEKSTIIRSLKSVAYSANIDRNLLSGILLEALVSQDAEVRSGGMWLLGGLGSSFRPSVDAEPSILSALLDVLKKDRSIPTSWFISSFSNVYGELPVWAEAKLNQLIAQENESRRASLEHEKLMWQREQLSSRNKN